MRGIHKLFFQLSLFALLQFCLTTRADVIILQNGDVMTGTILQTNSDDVLVRFDYGTYSYPQSQIKDVRVETNASPVQYSPQRVPNWAEIISALATNSWAHDLKQIPATVIDNGVLKDVPYISFRCNSAGYEVNIYGDLDKPAGFEIGAINYLVKNEDAKRNCVNFISSLLNNNDSAIVHALSTSQKDLEKNKGMTFETTFPDEPDAYGGWWVSVYDESALAKARASGAELLSITQPRVAPSQQQAVISTWQSNSTTRDPSSNWSANEMSDSGNSGYSGDRVYVRGYYRRDGTYVHSYTRRYPAR
ncbi:MAG TPA: hypothetical protein VNV43_00680 [Candidatus Acidoferrales bacterium]|jgi:hypothetical protein|nr:hypothetical protein [Candidatus Acidoferrales bacterium]